MHIKSQPRQTRLAHKFCGVTQTKKSVSQTPGYFKRLNIVSITLNDFQEPKIENCRESLTQGAEQLTTKNKSEQIRAKTF